MQTEQPKQPEQKSAPDSTDSTPTPFVSAPDSSRSRKRGVAFGALVIFVALIGVSSYYGFRSNPKPAPAPARVIAVAPPAITPAAVSIANGAFVPTSISVKVGQAVTWTNTDVIAHTVTSDDPKPTNLSLPDVQSPQLNQNDSYSYVFNKPGIYTYHDNLSSTAIKGTVIVK